MQPRAVGGTAFCRRRHARSIGTFKARAPRLLPVQLLLCAVIEQQVWSQPRRHCRRATIHGSNTIMLVLVLVPQGSTGSVAREGRGRRWV